MKAWLLLLAAACCLPVQAETLEFKQFGTLNLYRPSGTPHEVVLFFSGDGGWNLGVVTMAQHLAQQGAVVVGIDVRTYLAALENETEACVSPSDEMQDLDRFVQAQLGLKSHIEPTLAGYSSGATLVYATLVQSLEGTFKGALSLGFCPDLDLKKPLCAGSGIASEPRRDAQGVLKGVNFLPAHALPGRWVALQGGLDEVCPAPATQGFVAAVPGAELVLLPKVGHGYSIEKNWVPQFNSAFKRIVKVDAAHAQKGPLQDLPLTLVPAVDAHGGEWFGVFLTGDGGWVSFDRGVSQELAKHDIPIVGWDSLKYFWTRRTPQGASQDLARVMQYYAAAWHRSRALLIGFSQGADTMPFMVNRLPPDLHRMVGYTTLLGLSDNAVFEFHVSNWLGKAHPTLPTGPELEHWHGAPYLCMAGDADSDAACRQLTGQDGEALIVPGDHHLGSHYAQIAQTILDRLPATSAVE